MKKIISALLALVLTFGCVFALASCGDPAKDSEDAVEALKDEDYSVTVKENIGDVETTVYAFKNDVNNKTFDEIELYYFKSEEAAEKAWETLSELYEKEAETKKGSNAEIKYGIKGNLIYKGTEDAVKAAK